MITDTIPQKPIRGQIARLAIQCTCPDTGKTGNFLFTGDSHKVSCSRVSPLYADLYEAFPAMQKAGWHQTENTLQTHYIFEP